MFLPVRLDDAFPSDHNIAAPAHRRGIPIEQSNDKTIAQRVRGNRCHVFFATPTPAMLEKRVGAQASTCDFEEDRIGSFIELAPRTWLKLRSTLCLFLHILLPVV